MMVVVVPPPPAGPSRAPTPPPSALRGAPPAPPPRPRPRTLPPLLATIHRRPLRPLPPGLARAGPGRRRGRTAPPGPVRRVVVSSARASGPGAPRRAAPRPPSSRPRGPMGFGTRPKCPGHPTPLSGPMRGRSGVHGCGAGAVDPPAGAGAPRGPAPRPFAASEGDLMGLRGSGDLDRGKRRLLRDRGQLLLSLAPVKCATGGGRGQDAGVRSESRSRTEPRESPERAVERREGRKPKKRLGNCDGKRLNFGHFFTVFCARGD